MSLQNPKTVEELQMENQALKQLSDTLSKRLHMWEVNAQSSSLALQQSLRLMHHHNTGSPEQLAQGSSAATSPVAQMSSAPAMSEDRKVKELEELARRNQQELDRVAQENEKLKNVLGRYRDRWEKLKEGAKTRRAEGRSADGQSSQRPDIPVSPQPDADYSNPGAGRTASGSDTGGNADAGP
jgi:small-conductance mechanosensitive channel